MALHAKAKAEAGYRFYALYDKISREDILAHAYALCRSNKGAPRVDGQNFADIDAYGVRQWLGELALALRQETYRPDPIRRVFIPKANERTGHADLPHPALGQNFTPSPTARRAQAGIGVRARSAHRGGKLRPLGISTVRDRVGMTAAMLVLEPIFEA